MNKRNNSRQRRNTSSNRAKSEPTAADISRRKVIFGDIAKQSRLHQFAILVIVVSYIGLMAYVIWDQRTKMIRKRAKKDLVVTTDSASDDKHDEEKKKEEEEEDEGFLSDEVTLGISIAFAGVLVIGLAVYGYLYVKKKYTDSISLTEIMARQAGLTMELLLSMLPAITLLVISSIAFQLNQKSFGNTLTMMGIIGLLYFSAYGFVYSKISMETSNASMIIFVVAPALIIIALGEFFSRAGTKALKDICYTVAFAWGLIIFALHQRKIQALRKAEENEIYYEGLKNDLAEGANQIKETALSPFYWIWDKLPDWPTVGAVTGADPVNLDENGQHPGVKWHGYIWQSYLDDGMNRNRQIEDIIKDYKWALSWLYYDPLTDEEESELRKDAHNMFIAQGHTKISAESSSGSVENTEQPQSWYEYWFGR